jgi:hypothetical protein
MFQILPMNCLRSAHKIFWLKCLLAHFNFEMRQQKTHTSKILPASARKWSIPKIHLSLYAPHTCRPVLAAYLRMGTVKCQNFGI